MDGEITVDGKIYKYVKRKVEAGTLVLWCLPAKQKMQLEDAQHQTFKLTNDVPATGKSDAAKSINFKILFSDYDQQLTRWSIAPAPTVFSKHYSQPQNFLFSFYHASPEQPPEMVA